jgi:hypothetical protein
MGYLKNLSVTDFPHLTNSTEQSPSLDVNRSSASQEIPSTLWNPKVHNHIHNSPQNAPILSQINPVRDPHPEDPFYCYSPIYVCVFHAVLLPTFFPPKPFLNLSSPP